MASETKPETEPRTKPAGPAGAKAAVKRAATQKQVIVSCRVFDTNATQGPRVHDINGRSYSLEAAGQGTKMPLEDALLFLKDKSFIVLDHAGKRMSLRETPEQKYGQNLPPHLAVATLNELSIVALLQRARHMPGGGSFTKAMGKDKLIDFIMAGKKAPAAPNVVSGEDILDARGQYPDPVDETETGDGDAPDGEGDGDGDGDGDTGFADRAIDRSQLGLPDGLVQP
jgi:hypothetical protein